MARLVSLFRWLCVFVVGSLLSTACVRSEPPNAFTCSSQDDCSGGEECRSGSCKPIGSCENDYDCDRRLQVCRASQCVAVQCTQSNSSACGNYACDFSENVCNTSCERDEQCSSTSFCDKAQCVVGARPYQNDVFCTEGAQCRSGLCCARPEGKVCSDLCIPAGGACKVARDCQDAYCCARFASSSVCSSTPCLAASTCTSDNQCESDELCDDGACIPKLSNGEACVANRDCRSGRCGAGQCLAQLGSPCQEPTDCALEQTCCVLRQGGAPECAVASATCLGQTGDPCEFDFECAEGLCQDGLFCSKPCFDSGQCGVGPFSVPNVCVETLDAWLCYPGCISSEECQSVFDPYASYCWTGGEANYCDLY